MIYDFDLRPVYNRYDEYFYEVNRLCLMLLYAPWQKENEYPYENPLMYSAKELQEIMLKKAKYEENLSEIGKNDELYYRIKRRERAGTMMQKSRRYFLVEHGQEG